ncbi:protein kinase [Gemmatirosa kalamazoonensis]|uniref:Protein kinase n=1 Tax=Gemmatirosa kalamazoonensis TaxID=861299 RepID=W0RH99_9BACT|nr:serine/threonine-protein kinase [Gemmatirosa kalamazoonensis]AHG88768.1 protein kinase [Gemmatirosa kalamazoonensis]
MPRRIPLERWRALEPLLDGALTLAPEQRAAYLDRACGDDPVLRAEIDSLLGDCEAAERLLTRPALAYVLPAEPAVPETLGGRYRVRHEIGRGGMATVYLADDEKHGRPVAVKVLHAAFAHAVAAGRFRREIELAARLSHPHILPLHDSGEASGLLYYVMPYVAGETLRHRLRRDERLPVVDAVRIAREIALALDYAHREGVVHRDVKPENVLLADGQAVVADFGIAHALSRTALDTRAATGPVIGTPAYMSPEQALGRRDLDGRSDVYALGCVLHEMLTGALPTRAAGSPGPRVPAALASLVARATADDPADRFATAGAMADALDASRATAADAPVRGSRRRRVGAWIAAGATVAAAVAAVLALGSRAAPVALDADVIAVAPFDVLDPSLALWKEGMVDVLSRTLDGAGPLRAAAPTTVVRRWAGRGDAASARALATRTGAGLVVYGGVVRAGDSARARVTIYDARAGRALGEAERVDVAARMDRLADSLAVAILTELGRTRPIAATRHTAIRAASLPALRAFLQGEQFLRRTAWDSARAAYGRAVALDSTFALAYLRLARADEWLERTDPSIGDAPVTYLRRAQAYAAQLAPRDSAQLDVALRERAAMAAPTRARWYGVVAPYVAAADSLVQRYPDDPDAWMARAEAWYHDGMWAMPKSDREVQRMFDRVIALDSSFAPAYVHTIALAAADGARAARPYMRAYLAQTHGGGDVADVSRLTLALLDDPRPSDRVLHALTDALPVRTVMFGVQLFSRTLDSAETAVRLGRLVRARVEADAGVKLDVAMRRTLTYPLMVRGHLREALRAAEPRDELRAPFTELAVLGIVPLDTARSTFARWLARRELTGHGSEMLTFWAARGELASLEAFATAADSMARAAGSEPERAAARSRAAAASALRSLARGDSADALRRLLALDDARCRCALAAVARAELLLATGRAAEAARRLDEPLGVALATRGFADVYWMLLRARAAERLGRRSAAADAYASVAAAWRNADPELAPYAAEARAALARLGAEHTGIPVAR